MRIVAIGDSFSSGVGDQRRIGRGWSARLAVGISAEQHLNFSMSGVCISEVITVQLPAALAASPDLITISVGGNDAIRRGFTDLAMRESIARLIEGASSRGAQILVLGLADMPRCVPMPSSVRVALSRRFSRVNAALIDAAVLAGAAVVERWNDDASYVRSNLHYDRVHPSSRGHQHLAGCAAAALNMSQAALCGDEPPHEAIAPKVGFVVRGGAKAMKVTGRRMPGIVQAVRAERTAQDMVMA